MGVQHLINYLNKMAYQILLRGSFSRDVKGYRKEKNLRDRIQVAVESICSNPDAGEPLVGNWFGIQKYAFHESPEMRILYAVYTPCCPEWAKEDGKCDASITDCSGVIEFIFAKTREECNNLYAMSREYAAQFIRDNPK